MEALLLYFGKIIFTSGVMFLYYKLFLKDKTFHHYNRFYLLAAVVISLLLPLLKVSYFTLEVNSDLYLLINRLQNLSVTNITNDDFNYFKICAFLIGLVAVFFLTKLFFGLVKIQILKKKFKKENFEGISFYQTDLAEAPFSFFKNLFWKNSIAIHSDLGRQILKHEMVHIEQKHSWDKIFLEIITSLFWFNPFFYLIKKEINLIHEYLADKKAVKNSDTKAFAQMLLASHFSGKVIPTTSPFLSSNLKKRLTMLKKSKTKFSYARRILALPLLFSLAFMYLVNAKNKEIKITNLEIEKMVSDLKSDMISQNIETQKIIQKDEKVNANNLESETQNAKTGFMVAKNIANGTHGTKINMQHSELLISNDTIKIKNSDSSPELMIRLKDIEKRAEEAERKFNSPEFQQRIKDAEKRAAEVEKRINSPEFKQRIKDAEKRAEEAEKRINSPEFKQKIKDAEKRAEEAERRVNSPEFQQKIKDAEKRAEEAERRVNSPEFQQRIKDAEKRAEEAERRVNSPEFQQRIKDAEIIAVNLPKNNALLLKNNAKTDIYIDGKPSTNEEMEKLDPKKIESMHVFKKGHNGKKNSEIHVKLKK